MIATSDEVALAAVHNELAAGGATVISLRCDVAQAGDVESLAALAISQFGQVHLLFNNAGVGAGGLVWNTP